MKKILVFITFLFVCIISFSQFKNIIDYFNILPDSLIYDYDLFFSDKKWKTKSVAGYEIDATVDIKNGYIEIIDQGTGGGVFTLQVVLYRKTDGDGLIGISFSLYDFVMSSTINFVEFKNGKLIDVKNQVLPEITYKNFVKAAYAPPDLSYPIYDVYYKLPQYGTTIEVTFHDELLMMYCECKHMEVSDKDRVMACDFVDNIEKTKIELKWDKENRAFFIPSHD